MDKDLNQAIMVRSNLRNENLKAKSDKSDIETTVLNYCVLKNRNIMNPSISIG